MIFSRPDTPRGAKQAESFFVDDFVRIRMRTKS